MRVGIITLAGRFNYGNRLQNYATTRVYERLGFDVRSICLDDHRILRGLKRKLKEIIGRDCKAPEELMTPERLSAFDRFNDFMDAETVNSPGAVDIDKYDYFSVGSDQVWNPNYMKHREGWFFLKFAHPEQRIALAPSIGVESLNGLQERRLKWGVEGFTFLSVREKKGADLIEASSGRKAEVLCDPVLVLTPGEWRAVGDSRLTPGTPYVMTYLLGGIGCDAAKVLNQVSDMGRLQIVSLSDCQEKGEPDAGPAEFVDLIDNAVHVVTDSFHAAAFASIMETPLTIVRRRGGVNMFSRLEQLADMLGLKQKIYGSPLFDVAQAANYEGVPEAIERERKKFMGYLEMCLDG